MCAADYAFGPAAAALAIGRRLRNRGHEVRYVGSGTAYQLAERSAGISCLQLSGNRVEAERQFRRIVSTHDVLISVGHAHSIRIARDLGIRCAFVDVLFWLWNNIPSHLLDADLYIRARSLDDSNNVARYGSRIRNLRTVGPLVDVPPALPGCRGDTILVNFGGLAGAGSHEAQESGYLRAVLPIVVSAIMTLGGRAIVAGHDSVEVELARLNVDERIFRYRSLSQEEYLDALRRSTYLISTPGIGGPIEGWVSGIPTILLPPASGTQYLQLEEFRRLGTAPLSIHVNDYYPRIECSTRNGQEFHKLLFSQLHRLSSDIGVKQRMSDRLLDFLSSPELSAYAVTCGQTYVASLGGVGLGQCADLILGLAS